MMAITGNGDRHKVGCENGVAFIVSAHKSLAEII